MVTALFFLIAGIGGARADSEKLLLIGGGDKPAAALERFCDWAGGAAARVLVVTWATESPDEAFRNFRGEFSFCRCAAILMAPREKGALLALLKVSTAVFFTGGDQSRIMDVLDGSEIADELRALYHRGVPMGGTSAGTAMMSPLMITGDDALPRPGLGLLEGTILDTHFVRRHRENRLAGLVRGHPELLGLGIDEDSALLVTDGRRGEVVGRGPVVRIEAVAASGALDVRILEPGSNGDLRHAY